MDLTVKGGSKLQRELARTIAQFMHAKYFSRYRNLLIDFHIKKNLLKESGADGLCFAVNTHRPREYEIEIHSELSFEDYIKTIIHELIHVKQYLKGELVDRSRGRAKTLWLGKDHTKTSYSKQPWEREAYRLQEKLYKEFMTKAFK